jgi:hypothetical protein
MRIVPINTYLEAKKMTKTIRTEWQYATYDVWGNACDGYEVNDVYRRSEPIVLMLKVDTFNQSTPQEFDSATPTDRQIRRVFGLGRIQIDTDGDDLTIYVNRRRDGYPIGELTCISHESLSPIREKKTTE